ncbi:hypothetical protein [Streptomyces sp. NPDC047841]|uniref:hypothetical protein n=1 Tax=Streptomyces sp. NPDC047841 TaxID=3154708 RepID=UPI003453680E
MDYLGGWNERGYNVAWYEQLRSALDSHGYGNVRIVAADSDWSVANDIDSDPAFASAVSAIGTHYPCGYRSSQSTCSVPSAATSSGKTRTCNGNRNQQWTRD